MKINYQVIIIGLISTFYSCTNENVVPESENEGLEKKEQVSDQEEKELKEMLLGKWKYLQYYEVLEYAADSSSRYEFELDDNDGFLFKADSVTITYFSSEITRYYEILNNDSIKVELNESEDYFIALESISEDKLVLTEIYDRDLEMTNDINLYLHWTLNKD
jgi:hypothetical protein